MSAVRCKTISIKVGIQNFAPGTGTPVRKRRVDLQPDLLGPFCRRHWSGDVASGALRGQLLRAFDQARCVLERKTPIRSIAFNRD